MDQILTYTFIAGLLAATIRISIPLIFGTLGELFNERSGVLNLGIEGIMTMGAMSAFVGTYLTGSLLVGVIAAILCGMILSILMAFLTVTLGLSQHVSGIGVTFFGTGVSYYFYRLIVGTPKVPPIVDPFQVIRIPLLCEIPLIGEAFFCQYLLVYIAFLSIPAAYWVLFKTSLGLKIRTCGENPAAADTMGVNVSGIRYLSLIIGGGLIGLGGAFLTIAQNNMFTFGTVAGRGWVCIALIVFANWKPGKVLLGALLFSLIDAFQLRLPMLGLHIPYQIFLMLPYLITIVMLVLVARKASYPAAMLKSYSREE